MRRNIWEPSQDEGKIIEDIGLHYGFSRRLRTSMRDWDKYKPWLELAREQEKRAAEKANSKPRHRVPLTADVEQGSDARQGSRTPAAKPPDKAIVFPDVPTQGYLIVQDTLNYTTVDQMTDKCKSRTS